MPKFESYKQGTPSWTDCGAPDQRAAKVFYSGLFGWSYDDNPTDMAGDGNVQFYSMAKRDGSYVGAISPQTPHDTDAGTPAHWSVYLTVDDIDATTAKASELGANIFMGPMDVFEAGRMSVVGDPTGAAILFWQPLQHIGAGIKFEHGAMRWALLMTTDTDVAVDFYSKLLGVGTKEGGPSPAGGNFIDFVSSDGEELSASCMSIPSGMEMPSHWEIYFQVDDVDATAGLAISNGAEAKMPPMDMPSIGRMSYLQDPQGAFFGLITP